MLCSCASLGAASGVLNLFYRRCLDEVDDAYIGGAEQDVRSQQLDEETVLMLQTRGVLPRFAFLAPNWKAVLVKPNNLLLLFLFPCSAGRIIMLTDMNGSTNSLAISRKRSKRAFFISILLMLGLIGLAMYLLNNSFGIFGNPLRRMTHVLVLAPVPDVGFTNSVALLDDAKDIINARLEIAGVPCEVITGSDRIEVMFCASGNCSAEDVEWMLTRRGELEFRLVHSDSEALVYEMLANNVAPENFSVVIVDGGVFFKLDPSLVGKAEGDVQLAQARRFREIEGYELLLLPVSSKGKGLFEPYYVNLEVELTGADLEWARYEVDVLARPLVTVKMTADGTARFAALTSDYAPGGRENNPPDGFEILAMVFDGEIWSAPRIMEPVLGGKARINGEYSFQQARLISYILSAGELPFSLEVVESRAL